MQIVPLYAAVLSLLFVFLSFRIIRLRPVLKIAIGHGDNDIMLRAMRVHANFAEYVPMTLMLLFFMEMQNANTILVHGLCILFTVGRFVHAYGLSHKNENFKLRTAGMLMTFTTILACAVYLLSLLVISLN